MLLSQRVTGMADPSLSSAFINKELGTYERLRRQSYMLYAQVSRTGEQGKKINKRTCILGSKISYNEGIATAQHLKGIYLHGELLFSAFPFSLSFYPLV